MMTSSSIRGYIATFSSSMNNSNPSISITSTSTSTATNSSSLTTSPLPLQLSPTSYASRQQTTPLNSHSRMLFPTDSESGRVIASYTTTFADDADLLTTLATVSAAQALSTPHVSNSGTNTTTNSSITYNSYSNSNMQTELSSSLPMSLSSPSLSPPLSYNAHTAQNDGIYAKHSSSNSLTNHHHNHHSVSTFSNSHPTPLTSAMSSTRDDGSSGAMNSTISVKRQRTGRACDACRRRKVRCDGAVPHCSNCRTANVSCTFLDAAKKRGPPKGYIEAIESRLHRMESLIGGMAQTDTRVANASVVTDDYTVPAPSGQYSATFREAAAYGGMSTVLKHHLTENNNINTFATATADQSLSSRVMPPPLPLHDTISGTQSLLSHLTSSTSPASISSRSNNSHGAGGGYTTSSLHSHSNVNTINGPISPSLMAVVSSSTDPSHINGNNNNMNMNGTNYNDHTTLENPTAHIVNDPYTVPTTDNDPTLAGIMAAVSSLAKEQQEQRQQQLQNTAAMSGSVNGVMRNNTKLYDYRGYTSGDISHAIAPALTTFSYACDSDASAVASQALPHSFAPPSSNQRPQSNTLIPRIVATCDNLNSNTTGKMEVDMDELPDALTSGRLISIFRERLHPYLPILHWRRFLDCLASASPPKLLLNAVYAYASRYNIEENPNSSSTNTSQSSGEIYILRAQMLLDIRVNNPDLESVQALLLLASYLLSVKRIALGHMYSGMAVSLAQQLQLYDDLTKNRIERADHLRTWWGLLVIDRLIGTTFFHPLSIDEKDCCPPNLGDIDIESITGDDEPFTSTDLYFAPLARLSVLYGRALRLVKLRLINGKSPIELKNDIATLDRDLSQWWQSVPKTYRFDPMKESIWQIPENRLSVVAMITCFYHTAVIMIHRPWGPIDGTKQPWMPHVRSERLCLASAHTIACVGHRMHYHEAPNICGLFPTTAFVALIVLIPVTTHHPDMEIRRFACRDVIRIRNLLCVSTQAISIFKDALSNVEDLCILRGISLYDIEEMQPRQQSNRSGWRDANSPNNNKSSLNNTTIQQHSIDNDRYEDEDEELVVASATASTVVANTAGSLASLSNLLNPEPSQHNDNEYNNNHQHHSMIIRSPKRQQSYEDHGEPRLLSSSPLSLNVPSLSVSHRDAGVGGEELIESTSTSTNSNGFAVLGSLRNRPSIDEKRLQEEIAEEQSWLRRLCPKDDGYLFPQLTTILTKKEEEKELMDTCTFTTITTSTNVVTKEKKEPSSNGIKDGHGQFQSASASCLCNRSSAYLHDYTPVYVKDLYYWRVPISTLSKRWSQFMEYYAKVPESERQSKVPFS